MSWQAKQLKQFPNTDVYDHFEPHTDGLKYHTLHDPMANIPDFISAYDVLDYTKIGYTYDELPVPKTILAQLVAERHGKQ